MTRLRDLIPRSTPFLEGQSIGVEIELEGVRHFQHFLDSEICMGYNWVVTEDGSLRNGGVELISPPLEQSTIVDNIRSAYDAVSVSMGVGSIRTGIHVHFDMTGKTPEEIGAVCAFYSIVEPSLYSLLPEDREQNIYCVPWYRAPSEAVRLRQWLEAPSRIYALSNGVKYTGLNICALANHGTLEFRMAPTYETAEELLLWIETLMYIVETGLGYGSASSVLRQISTNGIPASKLLPDVAANAVRYDSYYCAEVLGGTPVPTWDVPVLDLDDAEVIGDPSFSFGGLQSLQERGVTLPSWTTDVSVDEAPSTSTQVEPPLTQEQLHVLAQFRERTQIDALFATETDQPITTHRRTR